MEAVCLQPCAPRVTLLIKLQIYILKQSEALVSQLNESPHTSHHSHVIQISTAEQNKSQTA